MMKIKLLTACLLFALSISAQQQLSFRTALFKTGDNPEWSAVGYDDSKWTTIKTFQGYDQQGFGNYDGFSWYRFRFTLPREMLDNSYFKEWIQVYVAKIDDADEVYWNGVKIGKTGAFPSDEGGYVSAYMHDRNYRVAAHAPFVNWGGENVLAVRVYDDSGIGGINYGIPRIYIHDLIDMLEVKSSFAKGQNILTLKNGATQHQKGSYTITTTDTHTGRELTKMAGKLNLAPGKELVRKIVYPVNERIEMKVIYTDNRTGKSSTTAVITPYILTPTPQPAPRINSPRVFGVRPGSPIIFKVAASGSKPMTYSAKNLPAGVSINAVNGVMSGAVKVAGDYPITIEVSNVAGRATQNFVLRVGSKLSLTPPMGWNSWNCWGASVTQEKVESSARALIDKGLADYGWSYINIDDAWQSKERTAEGVLLPGSHFPDIVGLADKLHADGLKLGIYSSPGPLTCAHELGSWEYEALDAKTYADWGIDYLKYDWCGYDQIFARENENSLTAYMKPYIHMERELAKQNRDIVYSLCQYGMSEVWQWGEAAGGNCWRTTGDITDTWESLRFIAMEQRNLYPYAKPAHWNDPDMLVVGKVGWGDNLHPTRLTVDEQYLHITLWSLLASPLLIGCDIAQMDEFTLGLLTNAEVNELNQDPLGKQARVVKQMGDITVWLKELEDGSKAVGIVNMEEKDTNLKLTLDELGVGNAKRIRDVWRQQDLPFTQNLSLFVPKHGALLYRFF